MLLIPCPPAGARARLDAIDEATATPAEFTAAARYVIELDTGRGGEELKLAYVAAAAINVSGPNL